MGPASAGEESGAPMSYREPQPYVSVGLHLGQGREPTGLQRGRGRALKAISPPSS